MKSRLGRWVAIAGLTLAVRCVASEATFAVKIAPQALETALQEFARQSGTQIIFFSQVTDRLTTAGLDGRYTLSDAMRRLLADSGLTFRTLNEQAIEVRPATPVGRGEPRSADASREAPRSASGADSMDEIVVRGTAEQLVATRMATPLREIPQSFTIVSREEIREQNARDLGEVIARVPGIVTVRKNSLDPAFYSRGYKVSTFHIDGGAAVNPHIDWALDSEVPLASPDLSEYDHIEVLRGADALFGGLGSPGGTVSLVRKRPQRDFEFDVSGTGGSWDSQRVELDVTGPLADGGALRGRGGAMYSHQHYFYDGAKRERRKAYGSLEYDVSPGGTLTAGASFEADDARPFVDGLLMYSDGTRPDFPRSQTMAFNWAFYNTDTAQAYLQYRQALGDGWHLRVNAFGWKSETDYGYGAFGTWVDQPTNVIADLGEAVFSTHPNANRQKSFDIAVSGTLNLFGLREEIAIGADVLSLDLEMDFNRYRAADDILSLDGFDIRAIPDPRIGQVPWYTTSNAHMTLDQYGAFASMRVLFGDAWSAIVGARVNRDAVRFRSHGDGILGPDDTDMRSDESGVITSFGGLMYAISGNLSWYSSYAEMFQNEDTFSVLSLNTVGTIKGANIETGLKGAWRDGALNASLAAYRITQKNEPVASPVDLVTTIPGTSKSYGLELELQGELARGWRLGGGYSYNVNDSAAHTGPLSRSTPKHLLKLWTDKRLPGALARWNIGGDLHAQSGITATDEQLCLPFLQKLGYCDKITMSDPSYAVLDLRAGYSIDSNWRLAVNVNNVFDKVYDETLGPPFMRTWFGEPRNITLRVDGRF
jgi:outer membrane receptor for ferric coprogen and ferric-rhodotorulic acid